MGNPDLGFLRFFWFRISRVSGLFGFRGQGLGVLRFDLLSLITPHKVRVQGIRTSCVGLEAT